MKDHIFELRRKMTIAVIYTTKQLWKKSLKKIQAWTGFEPMTSAIALQCSTNWAVKPTGSWLHCEFVISYENVRKSRFFLEYDSSNLTWQLNWSSECILWRWTPAIFQATSKLNFRLRLLWWQKLTWFFHHFLLRFADFAVQFCLIRCKFSFHEKPFESSLTLFSHFDWFWPY